MIEQYDLAEYEPQYLQGVIDLLSIMWRDNNRNRVAERFRWRYEDNPYYKRPLVFIALFGGKVVALRAMVVQQFRVSDKVFNLCSPADAIVHPDHRRKGLFLSITEYAVKQIEKLDKEHSVAFYLNLSSNANSTPGYLQLGWKVLCEKDYYTFFSLASMIKRLIRHSRSVVHDMTFKGENNYQLIISNEIRAKDIVSVREKLECAIGGYRDERFYDWRFSGRTNLTCVYAYRNLKLYAYIIISPGKYYSCNIEEFGYCNISDLRDCIRYLIKCQNYVVVRAFYLGRGLGTDSALVKIGFKRDSRIVLKLFKKERTPILIRPPSLGYSDKDFIVNNINISDRDEWELFKTDVH